MSRYIDADLIHYFKTFNPNKKDKCVADMAWRSDIDAVPTADVREVVHGEWIKITDVDIKLMGRQIKELHYKCSACGGEYHFDTNYCPHCGAKMDERRNNELHKRL